MWCVGTYALAEPLKCEIVQLERATKKLCNKESPVAQGLEMMKGSSITANTPCTSI